MSFMTTLLPTKQILNRNIQSLQEMDVTGTIKRSPSLAEENRLPEQLMGKIPPSLSVLRVLTSIIFMQLARGMLN